MYISRFLVMSLTSTSMSLHFANAVMHYGKQEENNSFYIWLNIYGYKIGSSLIDDPSPFVTVNCTCIIFSIRFLISLTQSSVEDILQVLIVFTVETLELDFALLFPDRHVLLRVLPVLVVLATSSEKDSESLYKRVKINRLINIFKVCKLLFVL